MNSFIPNPDGLDGESRLARFERLLKQDVGEPRIDWSIIEAALDHRIRSLDRLQELSAIKADAPADMGLFERIENALMTRIAEYKEYNQPIDDVIASPSPALEGQWMRMENHLEDRILSVQGLEPWEQMIKASEQPAPALYENIEEKLDANFPQAPAEDWEKLVAADEYAMTQGKLETVEQNLFTRISLTERQADLVNAGFALNFGWLWKSPVAKLTWVLALASVLSLSGIRFYRNVSSPIATVIYQAQGSMAQIDGLLPVGSAVSLSKTSELASGPGGAVTVANGRGYVELRNGAAVRLEKATKREVRYRFVPKEGQLALGKATFFVNKRTGKEKFEVITPNYDIEVVGTYFQVNPDLDGRVSTTVLEGRVKITSPEFGELSLSQGQSLVYDEVSGRYQVRNGGTIVAREAIETVPEMSDLRNSEVLVIGSSQAQAEIYLDGRYRGVTPLAILQTPGSHQLQLKKEGFITVDTLIQVVKGTANHLVADMKPRSEKVASAPTKRTPTRLPTTLAADSMVGTSGLALPAEPSAEPALDLEILLRQAEAAQDKDWPLAIRLYEQVASQAGPGLRRQGALFAIARLRADHAATHENRLQAKRDFLDYLARFPQGAFAGESWLRLAELELENDPDKAVEYYLKVFERYPRHHRLAELQNRVGLIYLQEKRFDLAVDMFRQGLSNVLLDNESEKQKLLLGLHRALVAKGDAKSAERVEKDLLPAR